MYNRVIIHIWVFLEMIGNDEILLTELGKRDTIDWIGKIKQR